MGLYRQHVGDSVTSVRDRSASVSRYEQSDSAVPAVSFNVILRSAGTFVILVVLCKLCQLWWSGSGKQAHMHVNEPPCTLSWCREDTVAPWKEKQRVDTKEYRRGHPRLSAPPTVIARQCRPLVLLFDPTDEHMPHCIGDRKHQQKQALATRL